MMILPAEKIVVNKDQAAKQSVAIDIENVSNRASLLDYYCCYNNQIFQAVFVCLLICFAYIKLADARSFSDNSNCSNAVACCSRIVAWCLGYGHSQLRAPSRSIGWYSRSVSREHNLLWTGGWWLVAGGCSLGAWRPKYGPGPVRI